MPSLQKGGNQDTEVTQGGHCNSLRAETELLLSTNQERSKVTRKLKLGTQVKQILPHSPEKRST